MVFYAKQPGKVKLPCSTIRSFCGYTIPYEIVRKKSTQPVGAPYHWSRTLFHVASRGIGHARARVGSWEPGYVRPLGPAERHLGPCISFFGFA